MLIAFALGRFQATKQYQELDKAAVSHLSHAMDKFYRDECQKPFIDKVGTVTFFFATVHAPMTEIYVISIGT